jgi:single-strand DNA-binding protein
MVKMQVIGHLGKDAQVTIVNGKTVINFSVAHTEKFKDAQGVQKDKTIWVDCSWWTEKASIAMYLKKGTMVFTEGQPNVRSYTNQNGQQGSTLTLRVSLVQLLSSKNTQNEQKETDFINQPNGYEQTEETPF